MQYMGNVNKNKYRIAILVFTAAYITFLIFDIKQQQQQQQQQQQHLDIIKTNNISGLIFGGSNAMNSLSARLLSVAYNKRWHNASLGSELGSQLKYNKFILGLAAVPHNKIDIIVYSSTFPYTFNLINRHLNVSSDINFKLIPSLSVVAYLKKYLENLKKDEISQDELVFNSFGDYSNLDKNCYDFSKNNFFKPDSINVSVNFLVAKAYFLATNFPSSKIYIVLPSVYHDSSKQKTSFFTSKLEESFNQYLSVNYPQLTDRVTLIVQPQFPIIDYVCNDPIHATPLGRVWRTNDLLRSLISSVK